MAKIYVVYRSYTYEGYKMLGAFTNLQRASTAVEKANNDKYHGEDGALIAEIELDKLYTTDYELDLDDYVVSPTPDVGHLLLSEETRKNQDPSWN